MSHILGGENSVNFWNKQKQANKQKLSLLSDDRSS